MKKKLPLLLLAVFLFTFAVYLWPRPQQQLVEVKVVEEMAVAPPPQVIKEVEIAPPPREVEKVVGRRTSVRSINQNLQAWRVGR